MDFQLSEEQQLIQKTAHDFAENEIKPRARQADRTESMPMKNLQGLAELGFLGFLVPEAYGGAELGNRALCLALEEINRACASTGVALSVHNSLVSGPLVKFGSEEQKKRYLPEMVRGERFGAYALTEPGYGSDAVSIQTKAERKGDVYVLNGQKAWITNGTFAGLVIVFATLDPSLRSKGVTAFLVDPKTPGFNVGKKELKMGIRASETTELSFDDLEVPVENRLGEEGEGFKIAMDTLNGGRIGIAAQAIGIARACMEDSRDYANQREQFGKKIADFQAIQWKVADMAVGIESARLLAHKAAWLRDQGLDHTQAAAMAKLCASEVANQAATDAVQVHGGAGYCQDFDVERYFRDAKITEIYEGTSEIQRLVIARSVLGA